MARMPSIKNDILQSGVKSGTVFQKQKEKNKKDGFIPIWPIHSAVAPSLISSIVGRGKREGEREGQAEGLGVCNKIYHNCNQKMTNKLIEEGQQYIFGGANQLYYKEA